MSQQKETREYTREYFEEMGRLGGKKCAEKHGPEFYRELQARREAINPGGQKGTEKSSKPKTSSGESGTSPKARKKSFTKVEKAEVPNDPLLN